MSALSVLYSCTILPCACLPLPTVPAAPLAVGPHCSPHCALLLLPDCPYCARSIVGSRLSLQPSSCFTTVCLPACLPALPAPAAPLAASPHCSLH
eukprot:1137421-Pelagomonas_calceolata.AAC.4